MQTKKRAPTKGSWKKGESGNPKGREGGYQDFVTRARYLLDTYSVEEVLDRARSLTIDPEKATKKQKEKWMITMKMPMRDMIILMKMADALRSGGGDALDRLLDRIIGKPSQQLNIAQTVDATTHTTQHFTVSEIDQWVKNTVGSESEENPSPPRAH